MIFYLSKKVSHYFTEYAIFQKQEYYSEPSIYNKKLTGKQANGSNKKQRNRNWFLQNQSIILLLLFALIAFWPNIAQTKTYYVDAISGKDTYDGLSVGSAWQSIGKVNNSVFSPGDFILFKRGEEWRDTLIPRSSGTSGQPITFGAYGDGDQPIISGANVVNGWTGTGSYSLESSTITGWNEKSTIQSNAITGWNEKSTIESNAITGWNEKSTIESKTITGWNEKWTPIWSAEQQTGDTTWSYSAGSPARNYRVLIEAGNISADGEQIRFGLKGNNTNNEVLNNASIGIQKASSDIYDYYAAPSNITFGGSNSGMIKAGTITYSDSIKFNLDNAKNYMVSLNYDHPQYNANLYETGSTNMYYKNTAADETEKINVSSYSSS